MLTEAGRAGLGAADLSPAGRQMVDTALAAIDSLTELVVLLRAQLQSVGRRQPGARALMAHYGIGALSAAVIWCELGDCRRFSCSDQAVASAGWT